MNADLLDERDHRGVDVHADVFQPVNTASSMQIEAS